MPRVTGGLPGESAGMARGVGGPKLSDYGRRYYSDSMTKQEQKELHKWRMKNDPDYKNQIARERVTKKISKAKATPIKKSTKKK